MQLSKAIEQFAIKAGVKINDEDKTILAGLDANISDVLYNLLDRNLTTLDAAENNTQLRAKLLSETLNPVDNKIDAILKAIGATPEEATAIKNAGGTYKSLDALSGLVKTKLETPAKGNDEKTKELVKKNEELNNEIAQLKEKHESELTTIKEQHENTLTEIELANIISPEDYSALPEAMPVETKKKFVLDLINSKVKQDGLIYKREGGALVLRKPDGTKVYNDSSVEVTITDLKQGVITQNQTAKVSGVKSQTTVVQPADNGVKTNPRISKQIEAMEKGALEALASK